LCTTVVHSYKDIQMSSSYKFTTDCSFGISLGFLCVFLTQGQFVCFVFLVYFLLFVVSYQY